MSARASRDRELTLEQRRILRLATGTALALLYAEWVDWGSAYLTAVLAATILGLPLIAPRLRTGISFVLMLAVSLATGLLLIIPIETMPIAGVLLAGLGLFHIFFYGARGGSPIITSFMTIGLSVVPALGSESIDAALAITGSLIKSAAAAVAFVWVAHALFPETAEARKRFANMLAAKARAPKPDRGQALMAGLRATFVTLPVLLYFLLVPDTSKYMVVLIKATQLGQQANVGSSAKAARSMVLSTVIGGLGAMAIWSVLRVWPSLLVYILAVLIAGLVFGRRLFAGEGMAKNGSVWSYALVTVLIILGPAVSASPGSGDPADVRFSIRILLFLVVTVYSVVAVFLFDLFTGRVGRGTEVADDTKASKVST